MQLFKDNYSIEGVTTLHSFYGGTAAYFNSVAWVESSEWCVPLSLVYRRIMQLIKVPPSLFSCRDGRYAIFVAADITVYDVGALQSTGGAGAIAVLIGPNAPLLNVPRVRTTFAADVYGKRECNSRLKIELTIVCSLLPSQIGTSLIWPGSRVCCNAAAWPQYLRTLLSLQ